MNASSHRIKHWLRPFSSSLGILALAVASLLATACTANKSADNVNHGSTNSAPRASAPLTLPLQLRGQLGWLTSDGKHVTMADYRDKVLVLDFYATWCEPCRQSIPRLDGLRQTYAARGLEVIGLNVGGPDDRIKVTDFAKELKIQYALGFPDKTLTDLLLSDNETIPQTFVFTGDGKLAKRLIGYDDAKGNELENFVRDAMRVSVEH